MTAITEKCTRGNLDSESLKQGLENEFLCRCTSEIEAKLFTNQEGDRLSKITSETLTYCTCLSIPELILTSNPLQGSELSESFSYDLSRGDSAESTAASVEASAASFSACNKDAAFNARKQRVLKLLCELGLKYDLRENWIREFMTTEVKSNSIGKNYQIQYEKLRLLLKKRNLRWIFQAVLIILLGSIIVLIRPIDQQIFDGNGYYVLFSSLAILESNTGSCFRKGMGRFLGTALGGFSGWMIFAGLTSKTQINSSPWFPYLLLFVSIIFPIPWGVLRLRAPRLHYVSQYAMATGLMIFHSGYSGVTSTFDVALSRTTAVASGMLLNALIVTTVLPDPARPRLTNGLAKILRILGDIVEPAIASTSWLVYSSITETDLSQAFASQLLGQQKLIDDMSKKLTDCQNMFQAEKELLEASLHEINIRQKPRLVPRAKIIEAYGETRKLFYHIASLVHSIELVLPNYFPTSKNILWLSLGTHIDASQIVKRERCNKEFSIDGLQKNNTENLTTPVDRQHRADMELKYTSSYDNRDKERAVFSEISFAFTSMALFLEAPTHAKMHFARQQLITVKRTVEQFRIAREERRSTEDPIDKCLDTPSPIERGLKVQLEQESVFNDNARINRAKQDQHCIVDKTVSALCDQLTRCFNAFVDLRSTEITNFKPCQNLSVLVI